MNKIKKYLEIMVRMKSAYHLQFHLSIGEYLEPKVIQLPALGTRWEEYKSSIHCLSNSYKWHRSAPETTQLKKINVRRKNGFILVCRIVKANLLYSSNPDMVASAKILQFILDNYADINRLEYEAKTASIASLVKVLDRPENVEHVARLGLTETVADIKAANMEFQSLYETRLDARYDHKKKGGRKELRPLVTSAFDDLCKTITGLQLIETGPDASPVLNEIVHSINATIEQFTIIHHRHLGEVASRKKLKKEQGE